MSDSGKTQSTGGMDAGDGAKIDGIADQVRADIQLGHVDDDTSNLVRERLNEAGVEMRDEDVDTLADDIEGDASR